MKYLLTLALILAAALPGAAQRKDNQEKNLECRDNDNGRDAVFCEIREQTIASPGRLDIDAGMNGGIAVKGWSRSDVLVRSKVEARAETDQEARSIGSQVSIDLSAGRVRPEGPAMERRRSWSVSFEIFVPFHTDISAKAHNGGLKLTDLEGRLEFETMNGGLSLVRLAGDVRGHTTNGGVKLELMGQRWDGTGLDVTTTNGGIKVDVPSGYSARLETGTVNGSLDIDYPTTVTGKISKQMTLNLGSGGSLIRLTTTNGGVKISQGS